MIINTNIHNKTKEILLRQIKNIKNFSIRFVDANLYKDLFENIKLTYHYTIETFFRLLIPEVLQNYDKVIYLDSDTVVNRDLADLFSIDLEGKILGACHDIDYIARYNINKEYLMNSKEVLKLRNEYEYFQAGILLIDVPLFKKTFSTEELFRKAGEREWKFVDQDLLNHLCQGKVKFLHSKWNFVANYDKPVLRKEEVMRKAPKSLYEEYLEAEKECCIIHFSSVRPWVDVEESCASFFWNYARKCPFYESLLKECMGVKAVEQISTQQIPIHQESSLVKQVDNQGIKIRGIEDTIYVDGVMIKAINWFNRRYPIGSKKRNRLRKFVKRIVR